MPKKLLVFLTPFNVVLAATVFAILAVGVSYGINSQKPAGSYAEVTEGNITVEVDSTGSIQAADSLDLSFDVSGRVASVPGKVGMRVTPGQTLASLSAADVAANLSQAKANLSAQQAKLAGLQAGARPEDLAVSEIGVTSSQNSVTQAKQSVVSAAQDAYVKADDAIHNRADLLFDSPRSSQPHLNVTFADGSLANTTLLLRVQMEKLLSDWQAFLSAVNTNDTTSILSTSRANIEKVNSFLDTLAAGLSTVNSSSVLPAATLQSYQTSVATARTNVSAALSALNTAASGEQTAETALASAQSQYTLKQAGALPTDVQAQKAAVEAAQASVDLVSANLAKTVIRSPINGIVTRNDAHLGETVAPGVSLITVNSDAKFQIVTFVSEADVAKVNAGEKAQVHVDAYPDVTFSATVLAIDPAATMQKGVASYKTTLQLDENDARIKAGLTANVSLAAATVSNVLIVPTSSIITRGSDHFVLEKVGSSDELVKVEIGAEGRDGSTQILSGVSAGDQIRSFGDQ